MSYHFRLSYIIKGIAVAGIATVLNSCTGDDYNYNDIIDTTPPTITLQGNNPDTITTGSSYFDDAFSADDDEDGDLTEYIEVNYGSLDTSGAEAGTYTVRYFVRDNFGNYDTTTRTVVVIHTATAASPK